jgi:thiosulfate/3-mercaptopyruvate sulfurtransferase
VQHAGVSPDKRVITYCQAGVRAAHLAFVLALLGYPDVAVYDGSWDEWGNDPHTPVE